MENQLPADAQKIEIEEATTPTEEAPIEDYTSNAPPRGAVAFAAFMLIVYIGYYLITWFEVFVLRGA